MIVRDGEDRSQVKEERFQDTNIQTDWGESRIHSHLSRRSILVDISSHGEGDWNRGSVATNRYFHTNNVRQHSF